MATKSEAAETGSTFGWLGDAVGGVGTYLQQGAAQAWDSTRDAARWTAEQLEGPVSWTCSELRARPYVGAAMLIGVGELAMGVTIGYAGYLVLARGESPAQALRDALALESGVSKGRTPPKPNGKHDRD
jgi:hypothetical protein